MSRASARSVLVLAAVSVLIVVAGCSSSGTSGSSAASPTPDPLVGWASGVCSATGELKSTVASLGDTVKIDATSGTSASEQLKSQLDAAVTEVTTAATGVVTAVGNLPPSADSKLEDAQRTIRAQADTVQSGIDSMKSAVNDLPEPGSGSAYLAGIAKLAAPAMALALDAKQLVDAVGTYVSSADAQVKDAFGSSSTCIALKGTPSAS